MKMDIVPLGPLTGFLDNRKLPEQQRPEEFRLRQNFSAYEAGKLCRSPGFARLLPVETSYGNMDLHDQMLPLQFYYDEQTPPVDGSGDITEWPDSAFCGTTLKTRLNGREPITFGMEFSAINGSRKLIVGTQSRLYLANLTTRQWRILADGMGGPFKEDMSVRWTGAVLQDKAVFVNGFDKPVYWELNATASGCAMRSVKEIPELATIGLTRAAIVVEYSGHIHLLNVVMNGQRFANRIVSSDLNNAIGFDPADETSITSFTDLPDSEGEIIQNAAVLADQLIVYTDRAIYVGSATGDADQPFSFRKHYTADNNGNRTLAFPFTLVNAGAVHFFAAADGFYTFSTYSREPKLVDWIYAASGIPFLGDGPDYFRMDKAKCRAHVAGYNAVTKEIWFSWVQEGQTLPSTCMVLHMDNEFASQVDVGFTMFVNYNPDSRPLFRDWLMSYCACSKLELEAQGFSFQKEGNPITLCEGNAIACIYTEDTAEFYGFTTEDWSKPNWDNESLCNELFGSTLDDFCQGCLSSAIFIGAHSGDWCLKEIGTRFSREICTNSDTGEGTLLGESYTAFNGVYSIVGYYSILRTTANPYGTPKFMKNLNRIILQAAEIADQVTPSVVSMRVGWSMFPRDPNTTNCGIKWSDPVRRILQCPETLEEIEEDEFEDNGITFPFFQTGIYLYLEMTIAQLTDPEDLDSELIPAIGGAACFSSLHAQVRRDSSTIKT